MRLIGKYEISCKRFINKECLSLGVVYNKLPRPHQKRWEISLFFWKIGLHDGGITTTSVVPSISKDKDWEVKIWRFRIDVRKHDSFGGDLLINLNHYPAVVLQVGHMLYDLEFHVPRFLQPGKYFRKIKRILFGHHNHQRPSRRQVKRGELRDNV